MSRLSLAAIFIDCDSFFASVEQHLDPDLRGKPVAVLPVMAESSCCIAASYQAKAHGVRTGTPVREARQLCPGIRMVLSKPAEYIAIHHQVIAAVEECIHVEAVLSIDEMWCWVPYNLRDKSTLLEIAARIKEAVARRVSPVVTVSIGIAPNKYLAKIASKMRKPDGVFVIEPHELPHVLHPLALRDLHGIARGLESRLHACDIHTVEDLCKAPRHTLRRAWGGVLGERMWHLLRGHEIPDLVSARKSIGHSHVLPPDHRAPDRAWPVLCKLLHKACERLRSHQLLATRLTVSLRYCGRREWSAEATTPHSDTTLRFMRLADRIWEARPEPDAPLLQVAVTLTGLAEPHAYTPSLFDTAPESDLDHRRRRLDDAVDRLRARYGRSVVFFGGVASSRDTAPMRISFTHIPDLTLEAD